MSYFSVSGKFVWERWRDGRMVAKGSMRNGITNAGLNDLLEQAFRAGTQRTTWYFGLIRDDNYTGVAVADTMSSHTGWEEGTEYSEATRQQWSPGAAASQTIINGTLAVITINVAQTFKGLFITTVNTKAGTTGILWSTGLFDTDQAMQIGETLKLSYELKMAASGG